MKCLIVEDDFDIATIVSEAIADLFSYIEVVDNGQTAWDKVTSCRYDLVITDILLPGMDGFHFLAEMNRHKVEVPVLVMSGVGDHESRSRGLTIGAEDYLVKPFCLAELQIRVRKILNRHGEDELFISVGETVLNRCTRELLFMNKKIQLQDKEFALMELFMRNPNAIISRTLILKEIWKYDFDPGTNIVDVLMCRVRSRIEDSTGTRLIRTIRGAGYMLQSSSMPNPMQTR